MTLTHPYKFKAILAALGLAAAAASSEAAVISADFSDKPLSVTGVDQTISLKVEEGVAVYGWEYDADFIMTFQHSSVKQPFFWVMTMDQGVMVENGYAAKLEGGETIDSSAAFDYGPYMASGELGNWAEGGRGFIGFRVANESGGFNYGFADVSYDPSGVLSLHGFSYDNSGGGIASNAIPEPSSILLSGAGVAALLLRRRRRA